MGQICGDLLRGMPEDYRRNLWQRWMSDYWKKRSQGIPRPFGPGEFEAMIHWAPELVPVFPEVVDRICANPAPVMQHPFIFHELAKSNLPETHPVPVAKLLLHLIKEAKSPFWHLPETADMVTRTASGHVPRETLRGICDQLARLGYVQAATLRETVEKKIK